jgi:hypothetical protein
MPRLPESTRQSPSPNVPSLPAALQTPAVQRSPTPSPPRDRSAIHCNHPPTQPHPHDPNPTRLLQLRHHIAKVLKRRPHHHRHAKLRRLQRIMPPLRTRLPPTNATSATPYTAARSPIVSTSTTSIPSEEISSSLPAPRCSLTFAYRIGRSNRLHRRKPLRMPRRQHQQRISRPPQRRLPRLNHQFLFRRSSLHRASRHKDRSPLRQLCESAPARDFASAHECHTSCSPQPARSPCEPRDHQPQRILLALRQPQRRLAHHASPHPLHPLRSCKRPVTHPRIRHHHRHARYARTHAACAAKARSPSTPAPQAAQRASTFEQQTQNPAAYKTRDPVQTALAPAPARSASSSKPPGDIHPPAPPPTPTRRDAASTSPTLTA